MSQTLTNNTIDNTRYLSDLKLMEMADRYMTHKDYHVGCPPSSIEMFTHLSIQDILCNWLLCPEDMCRITALYNDVKGEEIRI